MSEQPTRTTDLTCAKCGGNPHFLCVEGTWRCEACNPPYKDSPYKAAVDAAVQVARARRSRALSQSKQNE